MRQRSDLHAYQERAIDFIEETKRCALFLSMGLGKSAITLTAISDLQDQMLVHKVLVIAPLRVANSVWDHEVKLWRHLKHLKVQISTGTERERLTALHRDADIYTINRENVPWLVKQYGKKWPFDMVVVDECFPEGTMILTPYGQRDIKYLKTGDVVLTSVGEKHITKTFRKEVNELTRLHLSDGTFIDSTGNHPFATNKGWVQARGCRGLYLVQSSFYEKAHNSSNMQQELLKEVHALDANSRRKSSYIFKIRKHCKKKVCHWGNSVLEQRKTSNRRSKKEAERCSQSKRTLSFCTGRKWKNSRMREIDARNTFNGMGNAICNTHKNGEALRLPVMLQSRFWNTRNKISFRDRRKLTHVSQAVGREKRYISSVVRVESVENIKLKGERTVYNLETNGINDYFANGILVHNCDSFKSASSIRFKSLKKILPFTNYMVLLTGTPSPNGLLDLWSQIYLLDQGMAIGRTMSAYKQRFFEADYMGFKYTPRAGADTQIHAAIQHMVLSMRAEDYLELPERIDLTEFVNLPPKIKEAYDDFERKMLIEFETGEVVEALGAAVLANKLTQFANGASYTDTHKNWVEIHSVKLDALAEIIEHNAGENILVAYNFKTDLERLQNKFPQAQVLDRNPNTIARWNEGHIPLLLAHPASAGHGINAQHGGAIVVWFGLNWSLGLYQQFNARLHRQGQTRPVRIVHIVARDTIDERIITALAAKDVTQSDLLKALMYKEV